MHEKMIPKFGVISVLLIESRCLEKIWRQGSWAIVENFAQIQVELTLQLGVTEN